MDELAFIEGLRKANSEAVGFITLEGLTEYVTSGRYIIQHDRLGRPVGYLLHSVPKPGAVLRITMAVVEYDFRERGFGETIIQQLVERSAVWNCRAIRARVAANLPSNGFWLAEGFEQTHVLPADNRRQRDINVYMLALWPTLWGFAA